MLEIPVEEGEKSLNAPVSLRNTTYNTYLHTCPCGFYGDPVRECSCTAIAGYQKKISGLSLRVVNFVRYRC